MTALTQVRTLLSFVKFEHTVFALPFAYAGMLFASLERYGTGWPGFMTFLWITLAMGGARTAAMGANRLIDAAIDAKNPRTAGREIPAGKISPARAIGLVVVSLIVLTVSAAQLGPLALALLPIAVVFLIVYPYTKRFTWLCHLWLGITDGAAAAGGWIAVTGEFSWGAVMLWLVVIFWMVGLDVIYATQDYEFDRKNGVQSIPARFGILRALQIAAVSHAVTFLLLLGCAVVIGTSWPFYLAVSVMGAILLYEHLLVRPDSSGQINLQKINVAFFDANGWLALTMLIGAAVDVVVRG